MRKFVTIIMMLAFGAFDLAAQEGDGIRTLIATPASAFDVYLHGLYVAANGQSYFGGPNMREPVKLYRMEYDYDSNILKLHFHISKDNPDIKGIEQLDLDRKRALMLKVARSMATSLGLEDRIPGYRSGLIQSVKIRHGWADSRFDELAVKNEIADRTEFVLNYPWGKRYLYLVKRDPDGRFAFSVEEKIP